MTFQINHKTILIAVVLLVGTFALLSSIPSNAANECRNDTKASKGKLSMEDYHRQRTKISGLNLVNGLYLTEEQLTQLIPLAKEIRELEEKAIETLSEINTNPEFIAALANHETRLLNGEQPDTELKGVLNKYHGREVELGYGLEKQKNEIGLKAIKILSREQMALVAEFKPCLISPQDENSTLTGSASGGLHIHNALKKMRRIPDRIWEKRKDSYMERILNQNEKHSVDFMDFDAEKERLDSIIKRARSYSDAEFELHVTELAEELMLERPVSYEQKWVARKVATYILNRDMEDVYIAQLAKIKKEKAQLVADNKD